MCSCKSLTANEEEVIHRARKLDSDWHEMGLHIKRETINCCTDLICNTKKAKLCLITHWQIFVRITLFDRLGFSTLPIYISLVAVFASSLTFWVQFFVIKQFSCSICNSSTIWRKSNLFINCTLNVSDF